MVLPVAFAPPLWAATLRTLRELTRVAVTALVLVVGLNGLAAAPAGGTLRSAEAIRPVTDSQATLAPVDGPLLTAPGAATMPILLRASAATSAPVAEVRLAGPDGQSTAGQPRPTPTSPKSGMPPRHVEHDVAAASVGAAVVPPTDPGRESIARRGPPRV
ncbi:hypothetical protein GA0074695_6415 [Micromonospora viridifaciens]|uniref:Uncharacterized protein n=1 Tax=Micromonospora viridifaciens TaxID=1881 RepID=A0A1C5A0V2_MICVI|nr:hypothetical protein [Micromonospora viridifaciens]SCF38644.1 hypothetical protein GA0074695_6415 [Micromonospora viridifaciens]